MFTIALPETVISQIFELHTNPEPDLSDEAIEAIAAIDFEHGENWMPTDVIDGFVTFQII